MVSLVPAASLVLALAGPSASLPPVAPPIEPIVGGQPTGELEHFAVVAFVTSQGALCTGTVVTPRLILTAAHCLAELPPLAQLAMFYGKDLEAYPQVPAVGFGVHPDYCPECVARKELDIYDFGFVELGVDFVPAGGVVLPITDQAEWDEVMRKDTEITLVGYGEDPDAEDSLRSLGIKRTVDTTMRRFSPEGTEFFGGGEGQDSCQGDSGGPALVRLADGTLRLAGITSRGSDPCGNGGYYGVPFAALTWVRDEAGVDLLPADCEDGDCLDISPPAEEEGRCSVAGPRHATPPWALVLVPLLVRRRRRGA